MGCGGLEYEEGVVGWVERTKAEKVDPSHLPHHPTTDGPTPLASSPTPPDGQATHPDPGKVTVIWGDLVAVQGGTETYDSP